MENEQNNKSNLIESYLTFFKKEKKKFLLIIFFITTITIGFFSYSLYLEKKKIMISEKYILAGIYLTSDKKIESKKIYKNIILKKNKFYSLLSLNNIIENNLEDDEIEVLKLFEILEKNNFKKEEKNLVKIKKALYLLKINKVEEGNLLLDEIISTDSAWKNVALEITQK